MTDLSELARLEAAATPGPWEVDAGGGGIVFSASVDEFDVEPYNLDVYGDKWRQDAAFIVALRNAAPALLAAAARQAELDTENTELRRQVRHKTAYIRWQRWVHGKDHARWADEDDEREEDINTLAAEVDVLTARQAEWKAMAERHAARINNQRHLHTWTHEQGSGVGKKPEDCPKCSNAAFLAAFRALAAEEADSDTEGRAG